MSLTFSSCILSVLIWGAISLLRSANNIIFVFYMFKESLFISKHSFSLFSSVAVSVRSSFWLLPEARMVVSSANKINFSFVDTKHRSLIYKKKTLGPKIDPWDTPHVLFSKIEASSPFLRIFGEI